MKRFIHGTYVYECNKCGQMVYFSLEKGVEEKQNPQLEFKSRMRQNHAPVTVKCRFCGGKMHHRHTVWYSRFFEAEKGTNLMMYTRGRKSRPIYNWNGDITNAEN